MNGKCYSEENLLNMIDLARQYVDAAGMRDSIIAKCHLEIGLIVAEAPVQQRAAIALTDQESLVMMNAIRRWQGEEIPSREGAA